MADPKKVEELLALTSDQLVSVYVGKSGRCACGCSGKHRYWDAEEGSKRRGYAVDADEVNRGYVRQTLGTIQLHAEQAEYEGHGIWCYDDGKKMYVAYVR